MIIYSVTVSIDLLIELEWLAWMKEVHIPEVMATGFFVSHAANKLLDPVSQEGTATYNFQYTCESMEQLDKYQATAAPALKADHERRYKDRFFAFRTLLETV